METFSRCGLPSIYNVLSQSNGPHIAHRAFDFVWARVDILTFATSGALQASCRGLILVDRLAEYHYDTTQTRDIIISNLSEAGR